MPFWHRYCGLKRFNFSFVGSIIQDHCIHLWNTRVSATLVLPKNIMTLKPLKTVERILPWTELDGGHWDRWAKQWPASVDRYPLHSNTRSGCRPAMVGPLTGAPAQLQEAKQTHQLGPPAEEVRAIKVDWIWQLGDKMLLIGWVMGMRTTRYKEKWSYWTSGIIG